MFGHRRSRRHLLIQLLPPRPRSVHLSCGELTGPGLPVNYVTYHASARTHLTAGPRTHVPCHVLVLLLVLLSAVAAAAAAAVECRVYQLSPCTPP